MATINIPGYVPMVDDPPVFDTAREAWEWLTEARRRAEDCFMSDFSDDFLKLETESAWHKRPEHVCAAKCCGTVYGALPVAAGEGDLRLAYSVTEVPM